MKSLFALVLAFSLTSAYADFAPQNDQRIPVTGSENGTYGSEPSAANDSASNTDTINTNQSSTMRTAPSKKKASRAKCTDRAGRVYSSVESGYAACKNEMNR